ncbi:MAG TPA: TolC family protein [Lacunisphaera sp.]|nr:TolC family protein [Lacunisphaera sp.]
MPIVKDLVLPERLFPQLEVILQTAVQQSPRMLSRALDLEIAENNRISARSNLLPSLGGYASYLDARDTRADLPGRLNVTKVAYNISLNQPLFYWGERRNNAQIGEIQARMAKGQYRDGYRLLAETLRSDYLHLIVQKLGVKRAEYNAEYTRNVLKQEETRLAQKVISEYQIFNVRLSAEQAQITLERARFDLENAKVSFARLAGLASLTDDMIPNSIPAVTYAAGPYDQLLAGFLNQKDPPTTEAATLRWQLEMENLNYANQMTRLRPKLNFVLGMSQDQQSYTINIAQKYRLNSIFGGVSVNWTLFDGYSAGAGQRNSLARRRQLENDYKEMTERLAQQAQTQAKQINFSARYMSITDRFMVSSEGNLKTRQDEFRRGIMSESDVSLAQLGVYDAQINGYNGRIDFMAKIGDFLGTVMEDPIVANAPVK